MLSELNDNPGAIAPLLEAAGLPSSACHCAAPRSLLGWRDGAALAAAGGLERCGGDLLLRSLVVRPADRGRGIGARLVRELERRAARDGFASIYLLTLDAADYFSRGFGYQAVDRAAAPPGIRRSSQFTGTCPASAALLRKAISPAVNAGG